MPEPTTPNTSITRREVPDFIEKTLNQSSIEIISKLIISLGLTAIGYMMTFSTLSSESSDNPQDATLSSQDQALVVGGFALYIPSGVFTVYMLGILLAKLKKEADHHAEFALYNLPITNNLIGNLLLSMATTMFALVSIAGIQFLDAAVQNTFDPPATDAERAACATVGGPITTFSILMTLFLLKQLYHRASHYVSTTFFNSVEDMRGERRPLLLRSGAGGAHTEMLGGRPAVRFDPNHIVTMTSSPNLDEEDGTGLASFNHSTDQHKPYM